MPETSNNPRQGFLTSLFREVKGLGLQPAEAYDENASSSVSFLMDAGGEGERLQLNGEAIGGEKPVFKIYRDEPTQDLVIENTFNKTMVWGKHIEGSPEQKEKVIEGWALQFLKATAKPEVAERVAQAEGTFHGPTFKERTDFIYDLAKEARESGLSEIDRMSPSRSHTFKLTPPARKFNAGLSIAGEVDRERYQAMALKDLEQGRDLGERAPPLKSMSIGWSDDGLLKLNSKVGLDHESEKKYAWEDREDLKQDVKQWLFEHAAPKTVIRPLPAASSARILDM